MGFQVEEWPVEKLTANPDNYRAHPEAQVAHLQQSLRELGVFKNVVARPDGTLLAGHGVLAAAVAEGLKTLPVFVFDGDDAAARKLMVTDNEVSRLAEDDDGQLTQLLESIQAEGDLLGTGHEDTDLSLLLDLTDEEFVPDAEASGDKQTVVSRWLVELVIDHETHEALQKRAEEWCLPGESARDAVLRKFCSMVQSR